MQDDGNSIEAQQKAIEAYAAVNGLTIAAWYIDRARSGTTDKREEFQRMIDDSSKEIFSNVIFHKLDRFARNQLDFLLYRQRLMENGVRLLSVTEKIDDTSMGQLIAGIMSSVGQYHSANLNGEVLKGLKVNAEHCKSTGGLPCLGYDCDPVTKKYVINPSEAEIVRIIFEKYDEGTGYSKLLNFLNSLGYKTKRGNFFGKNSLYSILCNEKYTGKLIYNKRQEKDAARRRNPQLKPREEWIIVPDGVPAIIEQELFDRVQARMEDNAEKAGRFKSKHQYLLSGLVHCGECERAYNGNKRSDGRHGVEYSSYECSGRKQHNGCVNGCIERKRLENFVISELYDKVLSAVSVQEITDSLNSYNQKISNRAGREIEIAEREFADIERKISRVVKLAMETDVPVDTFKSDLHNLRERKTYLESMVGALKQKNFAALIPTEVTADLLRRSREILASDDLIECRNLVVSLVECIVVYKDRVDIVFKISVPGDGGNLEAIRADSLRRVG
jgi:site-specific DNA recombinase